MELNFPFVTRHDILNFPFPYKLWLVVNLENCDFLYWNRDGTVVLLDLVALEEYLNSTRSIFKIKNSSNFLKHLQEFQFERLNSTPEAYEDLLLQYKNEHFQRHRLDLLAKIRRCTYQLLGQPATQNVEETSKGTHEQCSSIPKHVSERMFGDLCFMFHGGLSKIKKRRLRLQTILQFNKEKLILKEKLEASEAAISCKSKSLAPHRSGPGSSTISEDQVIELPVELFENPHDSVLNLGEEFLPEYAGYYGNCSTEQIHTFFGEYLPMYENGTTEVKKINADSSAASRNNSLLYNTETSTMQFGFNSSTENPNELYPTRVAANELQNINFSSNLEPIFTTNEFSDEINFNCTNSNDFTVTYLNSNMLSSENGIFNSTSLSTEDDISMEEFLKFKNVKGETMPIEFQQIKNEDSTDSQEKENVNAFPQMPTSFQIKLNEDAQENEANFRNFFSQYRASLNLLYDRQ